MTDRRAPEIIFDSLSIANVANSAFGNAIAVGNFGWSLVSLNEISRYVDPTDTSAGNIHRQLWTLVHDLVRRGILKGNLT